MTEIFNMIGGDGICDHWFFEHLPSRERPAENSFSETQMFCGRDERVRFDVHLWATADMREPIFAQVAQQLRKMAAFINREAAIVEGLTK
jgi:hypothetical protein